MTNAKINIYSSETMGRISSFQSLGAVDGPGLRCVVFLQGCPLRCIYCHNPETWHPEGGEEMTASELFRKIDKYGSYIKANGGVTISGGEPLMQARFVISLLKKLKENGYHTALDTSGMGDLKEAETLLGYCDLVICDLKFTDSEDYKKYCGGDAERVFEFLKLTEKMQNELWVRQVIVPGINDSAKRVKKLREAAYKYSNLSKIELLPFRKICMHKYESAGIEFKLRNTEECTAEKLSELQLTVEGKKS